MGSTAIAEPPAKNQRFRFYLYCRQNGLWPKEVAGHDPDAEPKAFDAFCPLRRVTAQYPPTLFVHGTNDTDVPHEQSVLMDRGLAHRGVPHELISVAGAGHGLGGVDRKVVAGIHDRSWPSCNSTPRESSKSQRNSSMPMSDSPLAAQVVRHVKVYHRPGRFGGWPANHGIWSWGDEILVGFSAGYHKDNGPERHNIDHDRPEEHLLARSKDGGLTWKIEDPAAEGSLIPVGKALHGVTPDGRKEKPWSECPGGIDFTHPDFALTVRMTSVDAGPSRFSYSTDRGHHWTGPFRLPLFGQAGIAARTDYLVNGPHDCLLFLTAAKANRKEGRPLCVRTRDGGKSWQFVGWIGPEPTGFAIMPSTVRLNDREL